MRRTCSRSATRISPIGSPPTWTKFERCTPGSRREPAADPRLGHSQDQDLAVLLGFSLLLRRSLQLDTARPEQINGKYERGREDDDEQRVPRRADLRLVQHRRRKELGDGDGRDGEQELEDRGTDAQGDRLPLTPAPTDDELDDVEVRAPYSRPSE